MITKKNSLVSALIFLLCIFIILSSCGNEKNNEDNRILNQEDFITATYEDDIKSISIKYPEMLSDFSSKEKVNMIIKKELFDYETIYDYISNNDNQTKGSFLKTNYDISINKEILSIIFYIDVNIGSAAHPFATVFSVNIDISKCQLMENSILLSNIDLTKLQKTAEKQLETEQYNYLIKEDLMDPLGVFLKEKSIIVFYSLPHVLGDYVSVPLHIE